MLNKINNLKKEDLNCNIFSVYDYTELTITELLCKFFTKINECIIVSNETIVLVEWLVNEGLSHEVAKKIDKWLTDGTLAEIINEKIFKELNEKVDINVLEINDLKDNLEQNSNDIKNIITADLSNFNSLQSAHDYITANYEFGTLLISKDLVINKPFKWDIKKVTIKGYGNTVTYDGSDKTKYMIETYSSEEGSHPYKQATTFIEGVKFVGNNCNGIKLEGIGNGKEISHINIKNSSFSKFNTCIDVGNNSYLTTFNNTDFYDCELILNVEGNIVNAGENILFNSCALYNSRQVIKAMNGVCDIYLNNCSVDYNINKIFEIGNSKLFIYGCHFEHRCSDFSSNVPITVEGDSGMIVISNSYVMFTDGNNTTSEYIFNTKDSKYARIIVKNSFLWGMKTVNKLLCGGTGNITFKECNINPVPEMDLRISSFNTQCAIGTMLANDLTNCYITEDTEDITSNTQQGSNINISYDNIDTLKHNKAIKIVKNNGAGSLAGFVIYSPIDRNSINNAMLRVKKIMGNGRVNITFGYCLPDGRNMIREDIGVIKKNYETSPTEWEVIESFMPPSPSWATHLFIYFGLSSSESIQLNIGEILCNSY